MKLIRSDKALEASAKLTIWEDADQDGMTSEQKNIVEFRDSGIEREGRDKEAGGSFGSGGKYVKNVPNP